MKKQKKSPRQIIISVDGCYINFTYSEYWQDKFNFNSESVKKLLCEYLQVKEKNLLPVLDSLRYKYRVSMSWLINTALINKYGVNLKHDH